MNAFRCGGWGGVHVGTVKFMPTPYRGFPAANFSIAGEAASNGRLLEHLLVNPPVLGQWLTVVGGVDLGLALAGAACPIHATEERTCERRWPFVRASYRHPSLPGTLRAELFAPLADGDDGRIGALPVLLLSLEWDAPAGARTTLRIGTERLGIGVRKEPFGEGDTLLATMPMALRIAGGDGRPWTDGNHLHAVLEPGQPLRIAIAAWHANWPCAERLGDAVAVAEEALARFDELRAATVAFDRALPVCGDTRLDTAARFYAAGSTILTRITRSGEVLTMGYSELNQRDSFWTSWLHVDRWPALERRMLEGSAAAQRPDGKIPTCIWPLIDREDDLDITAYFILRVCRWHHWRRDDELPHALLPMVGRAIDYLASRSPEGLPVQRSFWGDWKDVIGAADRRLVPHIGLLTLAAYQHAAAMASALDRADRATAWTALAHRARSRLDMPVANGGLWDGDRYVTRWADGSADRIAHQDQVVGVLFGVLDSARGNAVLDGLNGNRVAYGMAEHHPRHVFAPQRQPGDYHNGAVWPYLSGAHAWALAVAGREAEARELLTAVVWADLEREDDWCPHECIHADTGEQTGPFIQGWDATMAAAIWHGLTDRTP